MKTEVLVIGAGPTGLIAAREAAKRGAEVLVLEEHPEVGIPNHCAGIVSVEGLTRIGVEPSSDFIQHEIRGGEVYAPDGTEIRIVGSRTRAYIIDRTKFDQRLFEDTAKAGAKVVPGIRAKEFIVQENFIAGARGSTQEFKAEIVINGEGATSSLGRSLGLTQGRRGILSGVNCEISGVDIEPHLVEVWLGRGISPGLFAWVIPLGEDSVRCGLACSHGDPVRRLEGFLKQRFNLEGPLPMHRGFVLTGGPLSKTYLDGLLVVGDAAGQTKPTTGGGVILGGICAAKAGEVAADAVESGDSSASFLRRYEEWWRRELGGEFSSMSSARSLLNRVSDEKLNQLFAAFKAEDLGSVVEGLVEEGDMDFQRGVITKALRTPNVLRVLIRVLGRLVLGEFRRTLFK